MALRKRILLLLCVMLFAATLPGCGSGKKPEIRYHFADREEAVACYLANEAYFEGFSLWDIRYRLQRMSGTVQEVKEFGAAQMEEFTAAEKAALEKALKEMQKEVRRKGYSFPDPGEITLIKSTQEEECGGVAYTHGTQIFLGHDFLDLILSADEDERLYGRYILWHELFHCLTRSFPDFRSDMYGIIHFTVQDREYQIPPSVFEKYISNPDVEHHNACASFRINGEDTDCFIALIATEPFEEAGDSFFDSYVGVLVPVDGRDVCYLPEDAENFWEVFGENTEYVIDPEECMADNFALAMLFGAQDLDLPNPEIIEAILAYLSSAH